MVSADIHVTCPHCGSATAATTESSGVPGDRLKGNRKSCSSCDGAFELYYY